MGLAGELIPHEGGDEAAQVGAAAGAAHHHVGVFPDLLHGQLGLQADDGLVEEDLVEHAAQDITAIGGGHRPLHRLRDGAAQAPGGVRVLGQNFSAHLGLHGGGGGDVGVKDPHDRLAEGLLLIGDLHHKDVQVQAEEGTGLAEGGAPLAGPRLGGELGDALGLGVVGLGHGGVELVGAGGVVALEFVVDPGRGVQGLLQLIGPDQRRGTVHLIKVQDGFGNVHVAGGPVQLLVGQLLAEDGAELLLRHGLEGAWIQQRVGLRRHVGPQVVPLARNLVFGQVDSVGDLVHTARSFLRGRAAKKPSPQDLILWDKGHDLCGTTRIDVCQRTRPLAFRCPTNTGSPDNGRSPRLATEPYGRSPLPSEVHSPRRTLPRSHRPRLSERVLSKATPLLHRFSVLKLLAL